MVGPLWLHLPRVYDYNDTRALRNLRCCVHAWRGYVYSTCTDMCIDMGIDIRIDKWIDICMNMSMDRVTLGISLGNILLGSRLPGSLFQGNVSHRSRY